MITLKSEREIEGMRESGKILAGVHLGLRDMIKPGISAYSIEEFANDYIVKHGATPSEKGFEGYKYATCVDVNDEVAHGTPRKDLILQEGDLVKVDMTVNYKGYESDSCWSYAVGSVTQETSDLMEVTKKSLYLGIAQSVEGKRLGDIGYAIQHYTEDEHGYGDVRELCGHGIGPTMHEEPDVLHYGEPGKGLRLKNGMTITIEPMINEGTWEIVDRSLKDPNDDWIYYASADGSWSAQYEHTLAITADGPKILTSQDAAEDEKYLKWARDYLKEHKQA
ncbi:methionine aminopeptidase [Companilactobacillus mindensis DSM 14500]|uniref:Methionine aminopeptidase n=1 Tax=Companilactobacillus mindensis DSM 14500 TaxID=1423770 RepID=A0A0R1QF40_9LACO|nr:type I methionyl aminopeptidase [Companilactobacillus mindensis]KRL43463.1 methionine aminopeptidase [Companilactobacillus mindensis DSM 14500]GEO78701.1 methionine aminopeptidase [Companilactobacillus mindensis]